MTFIIKTKKYLIQMTLMLTKYQSLKKKYTVNIIHLNNLLGIMIIMLLDHYIYSFHKRLAILINLKKNKITMSLMIKDTQRLRNYKKV